MERAGEKERRGFQHQLGKRLSRLKGFSPLASVILASIIMTLFDIAASQQIRQVIRHWRKS